MNISSRKGLLIFPILKDLSAADGIVFKNKGIINGFAENGIEVDVLEFNTSGIYLAGEKIYAFSSQRYLRIYQFYVLCWATIARNIKPRNYSFVWLRMTLITPFLAAFVKKIANGLTKIILEYGAYPFAEELTPTAQKWYMLNKRYEEKAHKNADYIITYCGQDSVDNLTNIPINNGIDLNTIPVVKPRTFKKGDHIRLICVSSLKKWHAYDRLLEGMNQYFLTNPQTDVHLDIVGNGPEMGLLVDLVSKYNLGTKVSFHLFKTGDELDDIYESAHAAIGTLGFHRIGITNSSSLKNREYFGRGLPIVLSTADKDMPAELPYVQYVPETENPVNIDSIIDFVASAYTLPEINNTIRNYAEEKVSWKSKIAVVLDYLNTAPGNIGAIRKGEMQASSVKK